MPPLISVIIPAYNVEQFISQAIQSVLAQTCRPHEIIVVDDGSTDNTKEVLRQFDGKIRFLYQQNKGPSAARNAAINLSQGELICFLDADDLWTPDKLDEQLAFMEAHPEIAMVFSDHEEFNEEGIVLASYLGEKRKAFQDFPIKIGPIDNAFEKLVIENFISTPTVMLRKSCLEKTGLFDEAIRSVEDRDLWMRISAAFPIACIPSIYCKRRFHEGNISRQQELALQGRIRILEKNWNLFPQLVPDAIWRAQLADDYCSLGFLALQKGERWIALPTVWKCLTYGVISGIKNQSLGLSKILRSLGLVVATVLGWRLSRLLWRASQKVYFFK